MSHKHRNRPEHQHRPADHDPPANHGQPQAGTVYSVRIQPSTEDKERYSKEESYRNQQLSVSKWLNGITAAGAAIAFLALIAVAWYARIAYRQLQTMQDVAVIDERAWIFTDATAWGFVGQGDSKRATASVRFSNTGKTPALKVKTWFCSQIRNTEPRDTDISTSCQSRNNGAVGPSGVFNIQIADRSTLVNQDVDDKLARQELRLYFWGYIEYVDFSKQTRRTSVCLRSETPGRDTSKSVPAAANERMGICDNGNDAN